MPTRRKKPKMNEPPSLIRDIVQNSTPANRRRIREGIPPVPITVWNGPLISPEIEITNAVGTMPPAGFVVHNEPSIGELGAEYVAAGPMDEDTVSTLIRRLYKALKDRGAATDDRSGIHFHLNFTDLTTEDAYNFVFLYCLVEPLIFNAIPERKGKIFCVPFSESNDYIKETVFALKKYRGDVLSSSSVLSRMTGDRYSALNISALQKFGTIEFRMFPSTLDANLVLLWMKMIHHLAMYQRSSLGSGFLNYFDLIRRCSYDARGLIGEIFPSNEVFDYLSSRSDTQCMIEGAQIATDFISCDISSGGWETGVNDKRFDVLKKRRNLEAPPPKTKKSKPIKLNYIDEVVAPIITPMIWVDNNGTLRDEESW